METNDIADLNEPAAGAETGQSRRALMAKAAGLLIVWVTIGATLTIILWLLATITFSLIGSL